MTRTIITSDHQKVVLGFDQRFVMIGERINPTGRKLLVEEMARGDYSRVLFDAIAQAEAGAQMLDINAGIPRADEPKVLVECIKLVQDTVKVPLSIDNSVVAALEAGLSVYKGKPLVNSVTGEEERLEGVLPLVMPVGAINDAGLRLIHLLRRLREELQVNTTCGASNFSFGLPNRRGVNASFLPMTIGAGMTSAIMNPLHPEDMQAIRGADVVMGHDPACMAWIKAYREPPARSAEAERGRRARNGRRGRG